jgi:hypothetical protein
MVRAKAEYPATTAGTDFQQITPCGGGNSISMILRASAEYQVTIAGRGFAQSIRIFTDAAIHSLPLI